MFDLLSDASTIFLIDMFRETPKTIRNINYTELLWIINCNFATLIVIAS